MPYCVGRPVSLDSRELRTCLGHFATGVTVVTCQGEAAPHGATVNAFTAVSLDPPLVQVNLDRRSRAARFLPGQPFTVNILALDQLELAFHFAGRPEGEKVVWLEGGLAPALAGCAANITCRPWRTYDGGDHILVLGEVADIQSNGRDPLLFHRGRFHAVGEPAAGSPWVGTLDNPSGAGWFTEYWSAVVERKGHDR
jgi:flavin reductase (DIM6/NTAB) family NADH-FMN oxidoreductase RutF